MSLCIALVKIAQSIISIGYLLFFCFAVSIQKSIIDFKSKLCWMNCDSLVNGVRTMINYIYRRGRGREIEIELHWKARNTLVLRQILNSKTTLILGQRE